MRSMIVTLTRAFLLPLFMLAGSGAHAQDTVYPGRETFAERNLGGPRLGVTYIPGNGELVQNLKDHNIGTVISQFGWHFEYQIIPEGGGPSFVIQGVPFLGGVEYGKVIPSLTLAMGIRLPGGYEFGMGPNVIAGGKKGVSSSLIMSVGKSFNYGGVSIPLNLAFATSPIGNRVSFIFGYAIAR
ncbi:MAG: hypothetical protein HYZ01_13910 [Ignavibacteriales bacterium]|nr:hypothetical protein [Ignavibacteriales bacterium]